MERNARISIEAAVLPAEEITPVIEDVSAQNVEQSITTVIDEETQRKTSLLQWAIASGRVNSEGAQSLSQQLGILSPTPEQLSEADRNTHQPPRPALNKEEKRLTGGFWLGREE